MIKATSEADLEKRARESAEYAEQHADEKPGRRAKVRVSRPVRNVFSLKVGADELDMLSAAAEAAGISIGAYIREAALEKAERREPEDVRITKVRELTKALGESVERL